MEIRVATWNILADSLSLNEFVSDGGDEKNCYWSKRSNRIVNVLNRLFDGNGLGVDLIATQENDHPYWLHHALNVKTSHVTPNIGMVILGDEKITDKKHPKVSELCSYKAILKALKQQKSAGNHADEAIQFLNEHGDFELLDPDSSHKNLSWKDFSGRFYRLNHALDMFGSKKHETMKTISKSGITCNDLEEEFAPISPDQKATDFFLLSDRVVVYFNSEKLEVEQVDHSFGAIYFRQRDCKVRIQSSRCICLAEKGTKESSSVVKTCNLFFITCPYEV